MIYFDHSATTPIRPEVLEQMNIVNRDYYDPKSILNGLKHFRHKNQEVILFHILDRNELEFNFDSRTKFVDMESGDEITTDPWHIKNDYKNLILETI